MKVITSSSNEHIKELVKLKDKKYRDEKKLFIIEGYHLVSEAKEYLTEVLITDEKDCLEGVNNILVSKDIINKLASSCTPQNIIGVCKYLNNDKLLGSKFLLLDNIQDPGNLGTLIRSSLGFGIDTIIASLDTVDIYNEKVIRATQGAIFNINYIKGDLINYIGKLKNKGVCIIGTSLKSSKDLREVDKCSSYAIILGNEGSGVRGELLNQTDFNIKIEMDEKLESLNVAVAGSIIMYNLYKKRC